MKLILILAVVTLSSCAKLDRTYLPPNAQISGGSEDFLQTPKFSGPQRSFEPTDNFGQPGSEFARNGNGFAPNGNGFAPNGNGFAPNEFAQGAYDSGVNRFTPNFQSPERPQAAFERSSGVLRQDSQNDGDTFSYAFETENGIYAEESGVATNGVEAQGGYTYTGDDGKVYTVRYTADQNGFQPQGEHLPTPPPIPEEILKALEQNARDEAQGIYDDGLYDDGKYGSGDSPQYNTKFNGNQFSPNTGNGFSPDSDDTIVTDAATFANQREATARPQAAGVRSQGDVPNAYLPPLNQARGFPSASAATVSPFGSRRPFSGPRPQNQLTKNYLPPRKEAEQFVGASEDGTNSAPFPNSVLRPGSLSFGSQTPQTAAVNNQYLPPRNQARGPAIFSSRRGPQKPVQPGFISGAFGARTTPKRLSFNSRDGYQY